MESLAPSLEVLEHEIRKITTDGVVSLATLGQRLGGDFAIRRGFHSLSHAAAELAQRRSDLDVVLLGTPEASIRIGSAARAPAPELPTRPASRPLLLRSPLWRAAAHRRTPGRKYFINRDDGEVLEDTTVSPPGSNWVAIPPYPDEVQRENARKFLSIHGLEHHQVYRESLEMSDWFNRFPVVLSPSLRRAWLEERARVIFDHVVEWARENGIPRTMVTPTPTTQGESRTKSSESAKASGGGRRRQILLRALSRMSEDDLLALHPSWSHILDAAEVIDAETRKYGNRFSGRNPPEVGE